ncbi:MAG: hypothetical protein EB023_04155, partial [Flavobacteriia bacterium]|nr:hypothetical protein [Flavobacteriia bacterium]
RYGNNLVISDPSHRLVIDNHITKLLNHSFSRSVYDSSLSVEERKRLSNEKYVSLHRDRLNEKSKRYYERNKEVLKQKREEKKSIAVIENSAQN